MRQLNEVEKALNKKAIKRLKDRIDNLDNYYIPKTELESTYGIQIGYDKTINDLRTAIKQWKEELISSEQQIEILQEQISKGVKEIKKPSGVQ